MATCYKCLERPARKGGLCEDCSKGALLGVSTRIHDNSGLYYKDFFTEYLRKEDVEAIYRADDELMLYEYYKRYKIFTPSLKYIDGSYKSEYSKLENWFSDRFFNILRERVSKVDPQALDIRYYDDIKNNFLNFRASLNGIILDVDDEYRKYVGIADVNAMLIFFKKLIRGLNIAPDYVDIAGNLFVPGSAMFFLELFALLKDKNIIWRFQNIVEGMSEDYSKKLIYRPIVLLMPWEHQEEAIEKWINNDRKGIIEMATATGKTLVGLMAIEALSKAKSKCVVRIFAHSTLILNQWRREAIEKLGLIVDAHKDYTAPIYCGGMEIHLNTLQTVYKRPEDFPADLLIVDEVHHSASFEFRKALTIKSSWKMGLSATIEGEARTNILERELGPIVYNFSLKEAIIKGVLPKFEWKLHTVYLSIQEEKEFAYISKNISAIFNSISDDRETINKISNGKKNTIVDLYDYIKLIETARYNHIDLPDEWKRLQSFILKRRWLIHKSQPKLDQAITLAKNLAAQYKIIIFTMDIESCDLIAEGLRKDITNVFVIHSNIKEDPNRLLMQFKNAEYGVLIGARMLDEGIDIPSAEIGINVASSKTRLQLVQRMGRILRMKKGKKPIFHHFVALPGPNFYLGEEDNIRFLDDLSWAQNTALKLGITAEIENEGIPFEKVRLDAEEMIRKRYFEKKISILPGYGTFHLEYVLNLFSQEAKNNIIYELNMLDNGHKISDVEWSDMVRKAHSKKIDEPLNIPEYWWILVLGNRNPLQIKEIFSKYNI